MCLLSRTLVTVALVQEKHHEQEHKHGGDVERRKESLGTRLLESGFDANLTGHINDGRNGGKVHLLPKKDVFSTTKERADEKTNEKVLSTAGRKSAVAADDDLGRRTFLNRRDVQSYW
jgi:hypothetical protein